MRAEQLSPLLEGQRRGVSRSGYCVGMARLLTKGPSIWFRLPLSLDAELERRASVRGETRNEYVRRIVSDALLRSQQAGTQSTSRIADSGNGNAVPG